MKRKAYDGVYNRYIKRGIDFCLALIGLVIAAIPMAIVAIAIKAESKGPVIFKQDRRIRPLMAEPIQLRLVILLLTHRALRNLLLI